MYIKFTRLNQQSKTQNGLSRGSGDCPRPTNPVQSIMILNSMKLGKKVKISMEGFKLQDFVIIFCCQKWSHILIKFPFTASFERWKQWLLSLIIISINCMYFYAFQYHFSLFIMHLINYWSFTKSLICFSNSCIREELSLLNFQWVFNLSYIGVGLWAERYVWRTDMSSNEFILKLQAVKLMPNT
jgi:hypothetical protein